LAFAIASRKFEKSSGGGGEEDRIYFFTVVNLRACTFFNKKNNHRFIFDDCVQIQREQRLNARSLHRNKSSSRELRVKAAC
jgi:hypothetical protein